MSENLGKLIRTLGRKCPECLQPPMQLRSRTLDNGSEQNYEFCPHCEYEKVIGYKEKGRKHGDKKRARTEKVNGKSGW